MRFLCIGQRGVLIGQGADGFSNNLSTGDLAVTGNLGIGTNSPDSKLHIKDVETVPGITTPSQHLKIEGPSSELTMGSNTAWNWIKTSNDFPLKIIGGDVEIDNGYLSVGCTTRYGVWEFANEQIMLLGWETIKFLLVIDFPSDTNV